MASYFGSLQSYGIKNPMYIGRMQRAVGGRLGFLVVPESVSLNLFAMTLLWLRRQCVSLGKGIEP